MLPINPAFARGFAIVSLLACVANANAELGGFLSVPVPAKATASTTAPSTQAAAPAAAGAPYQMRETLLDSGTLVREYAAFQGRVFAVSWRGPVLPDLAALLGTHFPTFSLAAEQARAKGLRGASISVRQDGLMMLSTGRMRAFEGYAYAPALTASVNVDDILQ
jgi:hypothetical protein